MIAALLLASLIVPSGQSFACTATTVWDGDGPIWCAEGPKIRLHGIAAREIDGSCRSGHPCPKPSGVAARNHLVVLLGGAKGTTRDGHILVRARLSCLSYGSGKGQRTAAHCSAPVVGDLSQAMIRSGYAARWDYR
jgi:endonuclease YncB( thermonuclease family)